MKSVRIRKTAALEALWICRKLFPWRVLVTLFLLTAWMNAAQDNPAGYEHYHVDFNNYRHMQHCIYGPLTIPFSNGGSWSMDYRGSICVPTPYPLHIGKLGNEYAIYTDDGTVHMWIISQVNDIIEFKNGIH